MNSLNIKRFDPSVLLKQSCVSIVIGGRGRGKSTLLADLLYHQRSIPYGIIMSGTEEINSFYSEYLPDTNIYNEYESESVRLLIEKQKTENSESFLLIDDLIHSKILRDKYIRLMFMNGRRYRLSLMLGIQYCMDIPPDLRANSDYIFIFRNENRDNQEKLWKYFGGMFQKFEDFQKIFMQCTENYECLVIDNTSHSCNIEDCVYWYKATPNIKFNVGCDDMWIEYYKNKYKENISNLFSIVKSSYLCKKNNVPWVNQKIIHNYLD